MTGSLDGKLSADLLSDIEGKKKNEFNFRLKNSRITE